MAGSIERYQQFYVDMNLERAGLFEAIQRKFAPQTVLYPGCSIHITPSFYFPHVVYVDQMDSACAFFEDAAGVMEIIRRRKHYSKSGYVRFIPQDFTTLLPILENSYDLLMSIYAGGIARACQQYLRVGGLLLTDNHLDDGGEAVCDGGYELVGVVRQVGGNFRIGEDDLEAYFVAKKPVTNRAHAKYGSTRPEYRKNADYYVFRRVIAPKM
ncbi:MAG: hypothetical protein K8L91_03510 [Anaerolineae bacterium]|nr:hypothetical protein [Anaerolineae bacterium]